MENYSHKCGKNICGLRKIYLTNINNIRYVGYNSNLGSYSSCVLVPPGTWSQFEIGEDDAVFLENISQKDGLWVVEHRIEIKLRGFSPNERNVMADLLSNATDGVIAIVVTNDDQKFMVGYSPTFEKSFPLRLDSATMTSGLTSANNSMIQTIALKCYDTRLADRFLGTIS